MKELKREIIMREIMPHYEYDTMEIEIEPRTNETRIDITIHDGYETRKNSRVSMSLEDFDRIALAVAVYRAAAQVAESVGAE